jgi:pimeloyl-ACP methyl ester carboxylesterase
MQRLLVANAKRLVVWLLAVAVLVAVLGVVWAANPLGPDGDAVAAAQTDGVTVEERRGGYVISPEREEPAFVGVVFYPGGRVDPAAYLPVLAPVVADTGVRVYVPKMPLTLAFLDQDRAAAYQRDAPEIREWYVGGHSLGGAIACRYASNNPDAVDGVVLFASYCDRPIGGTDLATLQILGSRDTVAAGDEVSAEAGNLPEDATVVTIEGANHSQFASYTGQPGDEPATIDRSVVHDDVRRVTVSWLGDRSEYVGAPAAADQVLVPGNRTDETPLSGRG